MGLRSLCKGLAWACALTLIGDAKAGHEVSYYPSFYPQEIRIEPLDPAAAGREFLNKADPLHAYLGTAPAFAAAPPAHVKSLVSLASLITARVNPASPSAETEAARCRTLAGAARALRAQADIIAHPYPITPYHADYFIHIDRAPAARPAGGAGGVIFRATADGAHLLSPQSAFDAARWDVEVAELPIAKLLRDAGVGDGIWLPPPWAKEGWFQAYQLLRPAIGDGARAERADAIFERLIVNSPSAETERFNLERALLTVLGQGCERAVIGYRLRREFYNDDFSNGVENVVSDAQFGLNAALAIRTMKLKDFPWNGWLRVAVDEGEETAWNPVAGFGDAIGRLVWSSVGDAAFLPIPYNSGYVANRAEMLVDTALQANQSLLVPSDALMPQHGTGRIGALGPGKGAMGKVTYRLAASAFQDATEPEPADLLYPFALAFRWGVPGGEVFDPDVAAATKLLRERLAGVRVVRQEQRTLALADLTFTYRSPIVEVYLNRMSSSDTDNALVAPPWSSLPWHVLALMEACVERNIAAFSRAEAARRGIPWLDLVRDKAQLQRMTALIGEFARTGYRPAALERLVSEQAAALRWNALAKFVAENGHLLVTNGPYRLASWSPTQTVLAVVRDFTYPVGIGTFDRFAYPPRALINSVQRDEDRILVAGDVEIAEKQQRDHRLLRRPLTYGALRGTLAIQPYPRYMVVADGGEVVAAGTATWMADGRFAVPAPHLSAGIHRLFAAIFLDGNAIEPSVGSIVLEGN
jgi:hypothetical protein